tara:strand:- start:863 stop:1411 length:549 start_codon:yes stop_codon:yes gene_type:complete
MAIYIIIVISIAVLLLGISSYNGLIQVEENIKKAFANIDVLLMQRSDELPKLVDTVKAFVSHEKEIFANVLEARETMLSAKTITEKAQASGGISNALKSIFALSEDYPDLGSNENFMKLQGRISDLENSIADRREFYNESVNNYNIRIKTIPDVLIARIINLSAKEMFQVSDEKKEDVKIDL